ncbi:hypothetical protein EV14_1413 [Prochlorococcus sp. MIT 0703]|nr:hypothetical protein EV14_1413 [Prochlorococcus sp. MIT 0703]
MAHSPPKHWQGNENQPQRNRNAHKAGENQSERGPDGG